MWWKLLFILPFSNMDLPTYLYRPNTQGIETRILQHYSVPTKQPMNLLLLDTNSDQRKKHIEHLYPNIRVFTDLDGDTRFHLIMTFFWIDSFYDKIPDLYYRAEPGTSVMHVHRQPIQDTPRYFRFVHRKEMMPRLYLSFYQK
jgi:hypothetical protein